jgi:hemerythrin-like domain-containing protein
MDTDFSEQLGLRLQQEHKALLQLSQVLREHIAAMPASNLATWLDGLRVAFDRLYAHIERCVQMKESAGYLEAITRERPFFARQVEGSKAECNQLSRIGQGIKDELGRIRPDERVLVGDVLARVERFMTIVAQHEQRENMMAMFAFNQDFGAF